MFRSLGYTTEVTPASRDGGYDILLRGRDGVMSSLNVNAMHTARPRKIDPEKRY